ncbi:MAG TPA: transposase [Verrucomicrobiae bacterium]|nr:transposase [Verrucomicrobiae bacterium]
MADLKRRLPSPPYNPGLGKLVSGKCVWDGLAKPGDKKAGFRGWHERGYLPHRDSPELTQFITFHLRDAFPRVLRSEWAALLKIENNRERRKVIEAYLDKGRGESWLRDPEIAGICEKALRWFDEARYQLKAWCLMPNHVHVLVEVTTVPMSEFVKSWKAHTAREANRLLQRQGTSFWADDYWDTYMRDSDHEQRVAHYIENNPVKAGLARLPADWQWSSARFRDSFSKLRVPALRRADF